MIRLTKESKRFYITTGGYNCPYCHSNDIEAHDGSFDFEGNMAFEKVNCHTCGRKWRDEYILTGIEEILDE